MNIFLLVFAVFYFAERVVDFGLTLLNLKHIRKHENEVPAYFREKITLDAVSKKHCLQSGKSLVWDHFQLD